MQKFQFTKVDSILAKYHRDFKGLGIDEGDAIEWIGEALGFMKIASASEEAVAFLEVKNHQVDIPNGMHYIIQIARSNQWSPEEPETCSPEAIVTQVLEIEPDHSCTDCGGWTDNLVPIDCQGNIIGDYEVAYYRPYFDLQYEYLGWAQKAYNGGAFSPVRLANNSFLSTLVCTVPGTEGLYQGCTDEYTIVQDKLRFSFERGFVAVAYVRQMLDVDTGYPMVPDDESARSAITYYMAWKIKQQECFNHREGACQLADRAEERWLKYIKQFKNKAKMPTGVDQYQNLMEQSKYLLPNHNRYYGFFGKLGRAEQRVYNDPGRTNRYSSRL